MLEQSQRLDGRAITQREAGFALNLGPRALYNGGPAARKFREWSIPFDGHRPAQSRGHLVYQGEKYPLITNTASLKILLVRNPDKLPEA